MKQTNFIENIWAKKILFFLTFFIVFTLSYLLLVAIDFVPETSSDSKATEVLNISDEFALPYAETVATTSNVVDPEIEYLGGTTTAIEIDITDVLPEAIYIEKLDKVVQVSNPTSRAIQDLDNALLTGAVRHPDSATLAQDGSVFILGHSSYLPNILNRNFQAFNGIQHLEWGDTIEVSSRNQVFVYQVDKVYKASANELVVPIAGDKKRLTIATCNSFGSTDDRFIVEATQVSVRAL